MKPCKICKNKPRLIHPDRLYHYICMDEFGGCVSGPQRLTQEEAEAAWDELMGGELLTSEPEPRRPVCSVPYSIFLNDKTRVEGGILVSSQEYGVLSKAVICNDGSTWKINQDGWTELPPIPGTPADCGTK